LAKKPKTTPGIVYYDDDESLIDVESDDDGEDDDDENYLSTRKKKRKTPTKSPSRKKSGGSKGSPIRKKKVQKYKVGTKVVKVRSRLRICDCCSEARCGSFCLSMVYLQRHLYANFSLQLNT
jgi:hypothetical protein